MDKRYWYGRGLQWKWSVWTGAVGVGLSALPFTYLKEITAIGSEYARWQRNESLIGGRLITVTSWLKAGTSTDFEHFFLVSDKIRGAVYSGSIPYSDRSKYTDIVWRPANEALPHPDLLVRGGIGNNLVQDSIRWSVWNTL
jgi:hypothetical protein